MRSCLLYTSRSHLKDSFPDCYDISSAGHIPTGVDFIPSAIRELKEELGYCAQEKDFIYCGTRRIQFKGIFHNKAFYDNQVSHVYILWVNQDEENFTLQKEEVSQIKWFDFDDCIDKVKHNLIKDVYKRQIRQQIQVMTEQKTMLYQMIV